MDRHLPTTTRYNHTSPRTLLTPCISPTTTNRQASTSGEKSVVEQLRASVDLMHLQLSISNRIAALATTTTAAQQQQQPGGRGGSSSRAPPPEQQQPQLLPDGITPARMAGDVRALRSRCMDIDTLYNTYAQPYAQWDMCLCLCNCANTVPGEYVRQLWDLLLKQAWETAQGADGSSSSDVRLALCCECTQELGVKFYPNENRCVCVCVWGMADECMCGRWHLYRAATHVESVGDDRGGT